MPSERSAAGRSTREYDDNEDYRRYIRERERRLDAEEDLKNLTSKLEKEIERRAKAEKDFFDCDSRATTYVQKTVRLRQSMENELQMRGVELTSARDQLELKEKDWQNERAQHESERQHFEDERRYWESEKQHWKSQGTQYDVDLKDIKSRWKQAAKELNGLRAQGRGFYQVTDNYLCDLITRLRYRVRDFGIQHFSEKLPKRPKFEENRVWKEYMVSTTRDESYLDFVNCSETRPSIIQAFLWRVIVHEVFCKFRWAGSASLPVQELTKDLESCLNDGESSPTEIDAVKKLHTWRATTVGLLLDSMDQQKLLQADSELQKWKCELHDEVNTNLGLLRLTDQKVSQQDFFDIIDHAVKIDKEISRQVSRVTWNFGSEDGIQAFDLTSMELRKGERFSPSPEVTLVTSPGVIKQGKSTGEGFESSIYLLKTEVSCEKPESRL
jgi:predicted  nucleic acid-binding Zn-ribbon protein